MEPLANPPPPPIVARKPPPPPAHAQRKRYRAIWSYNGVEADELSFSENEQIELIQEVSEGWWRGCVVRSDQSRSEEGLFPSNYVEVIPDNVIGTVDLPPLPPRNNAVFSPSNGLANTDDEKRAMGFHAPNMPVPYGNYHNNDGQLGPPHWQPGMTRWNSGGPPPMPPPPPSNFAPSPGPQSPPPSQNGSYYNQPPMPYGGATPEAYGPPQPHVPTEEEKKKHDKVSSSAGEGRVADVWGKDGLSSKPRMLISRSMESSPL